MDVVDEAERKWYRIRAEQDRLLSGCGQADLYLADLSAPVVDQLTDDQDELAVPTGYQRVGTGRQWASLDRGDDDIPIRFLSDSAEMSLSGSDRPLRRALLLSTVEYERGPVYVATVATRTWLRPHHAGYGHRSSHDLVPVADLAAGYRLKVIFGGPGWQQILDQCLAEGAGAR